MKPRESREHEHARLAPSNKYESYGASLEPPYMLRFPIISRSVCVLPEVVSELGSVWAASGRDMARAQL